MCLFVSMVYTMYLPNRSDTKYIHESFRDHKGTDKAFIVKQNNLVNYFKIFLLFFSKFTSSNIYGLNQTSINIQYKVKAFFIGLFQDHKKTL